MHRLSLRGAALDPHSQVWESLRRWFSATRRSFPWRSEPSPYRVWVSEVMLQQTRAEVVVPYFLKWMDRFPDVQTLAAASWDDVLKFWEGLGYYSRAQRLHQGAKMVVEQWGGELPNEAAALAKIPGLGPYTVEAIRAFAFKQHAAPVDGNVLRVWSRLLGRRDPIDRAAVQHQAREWLRRVLPVQAPHELAEALIELGATVCTPQSPRCGQCPMKETCHAWAIQDTVSFPCKTPRKPIQKITRHALLWISGSGLLLESGQGERKVLGHLWRLPTFDSDGALRWFYDATRAVSCGSTRSLKLEQHSQVDEGICLPMVRDGAQAVEDQTDCPPVCHPESQVRHSYVQTLCTLVPWVAVTAEIMPPMSQKLFPGMHGDISEDDHVPRLHWVPLTDLPTISFPSGHRSLVQLLVKHGPLLTDPHSHNHPLTSSAPKAVHGR